MALRTGSGLHDCSLLTLREKGIQKLNSSLYLVHPSIQSPLASPAPRFTSAELSGSAQTIEVKGCKTSRAKAPAKSAREYKHGGIKGVKGAEARARCCE